jgi:ABC-2 type transport system ATP-binding protein
VVGELAKYGTTILLTTQYLEEADQLADTVAVMNRGAVVATGTPSELKSGLGGERVELTFEDDASFAIAAALDLGAGVLRDAERSSISVPTGDPVRTTRELLALADRHALAVSTIAFAKPTLDDVFLHLTGGDANFAEEAAA